MQLRAPDQGFAVQQVDETMISELRHKCLGYLAQRDIKLKRAGEPLADALEQANSIAHPLTTTPSRLACHDHDACDLGFIAHGCGMCSDEDARAVEPLAGKGAFPRPSAEHGVSHVLHGCGVAVLKAQR